MTDSNEQKITVTKRRARSLTQHEIDKLNSEGVRTMDIVHHPKSDDAVLRKQSGVNVVIG